MASVAVVRLSKRAWPRVSFSSPSSPVPLDLTSNSKRTRTWSDMTIPLPVA